MNREAQISAFLKTAGYAKEPVTLLAGDASPRRYLRVGKAGATRVLMDAPPSTGEDVTPFAAMTDWLLETGLNAPEIYAADAGMGFLLIEDLGDDLFARVLDDEPRLDVELYSAAIDVLVRLSEIRPPKNVGSGERLHPLRPYDLPVLCREAALLTEWWLPSASGSDTSETTTTDYIGLISEAMADVKDTTDTVVLRDYHAENLIWMPEREGLARVGLLDYQDALAGHAAYDLVSLLEDARRDTSDDLREAMTARYLAARPSINRDEFLAAYSALGAQRNLKIVGIFARLAVRDAKPRYLDLIPRVWAHLKRDLSHPSLAPLAEWIWRHVPAPEPDLLDKVRSLATR
jgi:aminoglycoside/choline kinase family phosphotransferase